MIKTKYLVVLFIVIITSLMVVTLAWPIRGQRNKAVDAQISADIDDLASKIRIKASDSNGTVPASLDELDLDKSFKKRIAKNGIEYNKKSDREFQLCGRFKTDTSKEEEPEYGLDDYLGSSRSSSRSYSVNTSKHATGRVCFEYQAGYYNTYNNSSSSSYLEDSESEMTSDTYRDGLNLQNFWQTIR